MLKLKTSRRDFLKTIGCAAAASALSKSAAAAQRPNIVLIMTDDMGYSDIGCFGGEIDTPMLDGLAANGLRFTGFHSSDMCVPSRAGLMTGIYAAASLRSGHINDRCASLPESLRQSGYATAMAGKWHLGKVDDLDNYPCQRGFEKYYGTIYGANSFFQPLSLTRGNKNAEHECRDPGYYYTHSITSNAIRYIEEAPTEKPVFLYIAYTAAHWPLHALPKDIEKYKGKYAMGWDELRKQRHARMKELGIIAQDTPLSERNPEVPAWEDEPNKAWQERRMEVYAAQIDCVDQGVGQIMDALKETGRFDNTLLLYMIDNGGCHVEYETTRVGDFLPKKTRDGRDMIPGNIPNLMPGPEETFQSYGYGWANASNTPYRMYKKYAHEGGIHTPMIAHWPNGIKDGGALRSEITHLIDIAPTCLEAAGVQAAAQRQGQKTYPLDGISLLPTLQGKPRQGHDAIYWDWSNGKAVRQGPWKLVRISKDPWELYHMDADPVELNNLAKKMPEKVSELEALWEDWLKTRKAMD